MHMRVRAWIGILAVSACAGHWVAIRAFSSPAPSGSNPYLVVAERNMFDLKPIPRPEDLTPPPPPAPPTKITLQGITVLFGRKEVLLKIPEPPAPGQPPKERSLILGEGERHGPIEVVRIDPVAREVEFRDSGNPVKLKLTDFIAKTPAPPAAPAAPGAVRPGAPPTPGPTARVITPGSVTPGGVPGAAPMVASGTVVAGTPTAAAAPTAPPLPSRPVRATPPNPNPQPQLSLEEQIVLIELQRQATQEQVKRGLMPPLPPTELTPPGALPPPVAPTPTPGAPPLPPMPGN